MRPMQSHWVMRLVLHVKRQTSLFEMPLVGWPNGELGPMRRCSLFTRRERQAPDLWIIAIGAVISVGARGSKTHAPMRLHMCGGGTAREVLRGGIWHKASVFGCLPLAVPIGLSPLLILTLCGSKRVLVVSTERLDDLSCLTTPRGRLSRRRAVARAVDQVHPDAHEGGRVWTQKLAHQQWPDKSVPTVNFVVSHNGHFGLDGGGVVRWGGGANPPSPTVYGHSNTSLGTTGVRMGTEG